MFARENAGHSQLAYVTNDIAAAVRMFESVYGAPGFFVFGNVETGAGYQDGPMLRIALCSIGGVEIELIEPIGDTAPLFASVLNDDMHFFYTDERARLGHYIEHVWMSPSLLAQMRAAVPQFPSNIPEV
jgi:hypothetical protein